MNQAAPALEVSGLTKRFGQRTALYACSFSLPQGSSLMVFGPNGAGKTTLLRLLAMLDKPSDGSFSMLGLDAKEHQEALRGRIGFVSHAPMLYMDLTAEENLLFYARLYGVRDPERRVRELLEFVELSARRHDSVRGFSRGMMQRVCLARALVNDPDILLLDEPYSGLDPRASRFVDQVLSQDAALAGQSDPKTLISVTHGLRHGYEQATHVLLLARGKRVLFSSVEDVPYEQFAEAFAEAAGKGALA